MCIIWICMHCGLAVDVRCSCISFFLSQFSSLFFKWRPLLSTIRRITLVSHFSHTLWEMFHGLSPSLPIAMHSKWANKPTIEPKSIQSPTFTNIFAIDFYFDRKSTNSADAKYEKNVDILKHGYAWFYFLFVFSLCRISNGRFIRYERFCWQRNWTAP